MVFYQHQQIQVSVFNEIAMAFYGNFIASEVINRILPIKKIVLYDMT
jgi:hypothetical protein